MSKDQEQAITNKLRNITSRLNNHHAQYYKLLDELCQTIADMKKCEKEMLDAFKQELVGRSLSDGLSDKQFVLSCVSDSLSVGMEEVEAVCKKLNNMYSTFDRLKESEKAVGVCLKLLDGIE